MDVVALFEKIGDVQWHGNSKFGFTIGTEHYQMRQPHAKDLTNAEVTDLRHFLERAGWAPDAPPVAGEIGADLSAITSPQLLELAEQVLGRPTWALPFRRGRSQTSP